MAWMIVIVIALTVFFAGIIVIVMQAPGQKKRNTLGDIAGGGHVIANGGVDVKDLHYGKKKGLDFQADKKMYGTVTSQNGAVHHMWNAYFTFCGSGRRQIVVFRRKMAVGRKPEVMKPLPYLPIPEDRRISAVHCYLIGTEEGLVVRDAQSLNHTYVDGKMVTTPRPIRSGSILRVGHTEVQVVYEYR